MLLRQPCKYFVRTGVCPNANMCNRSHQIVELGQQAMTTLIFPSMYRYMLRGYEVLKLNNETGKSSRAHQCITSSDFKCCPFLDEILEYDEDDIKENFKVFYDEIMREFRKYGRVVQLLVCSNYQAHLRGNVYVQYEKYSQLVDFLNNTNMVINKYDKGRGC